MKAKLILENGSVFEGNAIGYLEESAGEVVFNTGMTGYQEILTDPSYYGQIVTMTYPLIGNYGINLEDFESAAPKVRGLIMREGCCEPNNWRCEMGLDGYLKHYKIIGLEGIDTRALTKLLRNSGTMKGLIAFGDSSGESLKSKLDELDMKAAVSVVTTKEVRKIPGSGKRVAIMDFGTKQNIIRSFIKRGCEIIMYPADTLPEVILADNPDLIFLSNGPGDPADLDKIIQNIRELVGKKPIAGICLGHQLLALAMGGRTEKLKFGHRGCNHPVKDIKENRVYVTSQNHGYYVSVLPQDMQVTHISMNDGTIEGMRHNTLPIMSVQFHPEASPGPKDIEGIFDRFLML